MGAICLAITLTGVASPRVHAQAQMSQILQQQLAAIQKERDSRTPAQRKIHSPLLFAARQAMGVVPVPGAPRMRSNIKAESDGRLKVKITATVSPELLAAIQALGGTVVSSYSEYRAIYALMPPAKLESLAGRADVDFIGTPPTPTFNTTPPAGASVSKTVETAVNDPQGDVTHAANAARQSYGVTGAGIKVGVMSNSINDSSNSYKTALADGYIPALTIPPGQGGGITDGEGLAMCEVVHRIAPGATLYFATGGSGTTLAANEEQMAQNIKTLQADGCKIILDDISYPDEDPFQDGIIAQAVDTVTAKGSLYFSCAANFGHFDSGNASCWEGNFVGSTNFPNVLDFDAPSGDAYGVEQFNKVNSDSSAVTVVLFWAEPLGHATSQYNLYEISPQYEVVQEADDPVTTSHAPMQILENVATGDTISVERASGAYRYVHVDIASQNSFFDVATAARTRGHNACDAVNSFCVAATPADASYGETDIGTTAPAGPYPNLFNADCQIEPFSNDGPRRMFFAPNGAAYTPGNFTATGGKVFAKPDFTAADGVTTSVPQVGGDAPFFGTSCATPHAGALAALGWSYNPYLTPTQMAAVLRKGTLQISAPGPGDRDAGAGILMAPRILNAVGAASLPIVTGFSPPSGPVGSTVVITGSNFFLNGLDVQFGGVSVTSGSFNLTHAYPVVPAGAVSGPIKITNLYGSVSTTTNFIVTSSAVYTVTPKAGADGVISPSAAQKVKGGGSVAFTATPNPGYSVYRWLLNGAVAQNGSNGYTLKDVTANDTVEVTFTAASTSAKMVSPVPGSTLASSAVTFKWSAGTAATNYDLYLGSTQGASDIYNAGILPSTTLSEAVTGIPVNGKPVYVTLWSYISGAWQYIEYTYTAAAAVVPPGVAAK